MSGKVATGNNLLRAYASCAKRVTDEKLNSAATSAGFILSGKRGQRQGFQVFVKMIRYSDARLKKNRKSGGLAVNI